MKQAAERNLMDQTEFAARHYAVSPHQWERWILIAVAMVALSACRGLDAPTTSITSTASVSQSAGTAQEAAAPVGVILPHASLPDSQVAQAGIAIGTDDNAQTPDTIHTNVAQTARTSRSLSDQTASGASYHVIPAQHQAPATAPTVVPALEATGHPASPPWRRPLLKSRNQRRLPILPNVFATIRRTTILRAAICHALSAGRLSARGPLAAKLCAAAGRDIHTLVSGRYLRQRLASAGTRLPLAGR